MESQGPSDCAPDADGDRGGEESLAALHERLFAALKSGDLKAVRAAVEAGADLRWTDFWSGRGVVFFAGSEEVLRYLIGQGFSIEEPIANGDTPMAYAIEFGVTALGQLRALIACGANVNATVRGWTLFQRAARCPARDVAVLKVLVEAGADPHTVTEYGWSAAHLAVDVDMEANCEESVRSTLGYLKEIGVDLNYGIEGSCTPLEKATRSGRALEVEVLCELGANARQVVSLFVDEEIIEGCLACCARCCAWRSRSAETDQVAHRGRCGSAAQGCEGVQCAAAGIARGGGFLSRLDHRSVRFLGGAVSDL